MAALSSCWCSSRLVSALDSRTRSSCAALRSTRDSSSSLCSLLISFGVVPQRLACALKLSSEIVQHCVLFLQGRCSSSRYPRSGGLRATENGGTILPLARDNHHLFTMPYPQVGTHPQVGSHIRHELSRIVTSHQSAWIQTPAGEQNRQNREACL